MEHMLSLFVKSVYQHGLAFFLGMCTFPVSTV